MARATGTSMQSHQFERMVCSHERVREFRDVVFITTRDGERFRQSVYRRKCARCRANLGVRNGERVPLETTD